MDFLRFISPDLKLSLEFQGGRNTFLKSKFLPEVQVHFLELFSNPTYTSKPIPANLQNELGLE